MKWILRILYILFVLIIWGFIELIAGGTYGIRVSEYIYGNITQHAMDNEDYDIFDALGHLNAVSKTYYSKNKIPTLNDDLYYDNQSTESKHRVKVGMYPHAVVHKNPQFNLYSDGFFIVFEEYSTEVDFYTIEVTAYNVDENEDQDQIILKNKNYLSVYTDIVTSNANGASFRTALIANNGFANQLLENDPELKFDETNTFEYHVQAIDIFATFINPDEPDNPTRVHIYRITDGTDFASGTPLVEHKTLNLAPETYNLSKHMNDELPTEANNPFNLELSYHPADLSPYNFVYWIVYSIYAVVFVIAPYFLFIHKHVMKTIRNKKGDDSDDKPSNRPPVPQLFSDIEPKSDK